MDTCEKYYFTTDKGALEGFVKDLNILHVSKKWNQSNDLWPADQ